MHEIHDIGMVMKTKRSSRVFERLSRWCGILLFLSIAAVTVGQEAPEQADTETTSETTSETDAVTSARAERREILRYGIDTQILEVLQKIQEERDDLLLDDVYIAFKVNQNPDVKKAAIDVFETLEFDEPKQDVLGIIEDWEFNTSSLVIRAIDYVTADRNDQVADLLIPLIDDPDTSVARAAIRGIGTSGGEIHAEALLERFESNDYDDELKSLLILAFGELGSSNVVDTLIEILDNPDEDITWRRYSCDALGKIGDIRGLAPIQRALVADDAMLRAYAVASLHYFEDEGIIQSLIQGLRDSFWRVRISAARSLGELGDPAAIPILSFKARLDPETNVRDEAIRALANIGSAGSDEAFDLIREFYEDQSFSTALRVTCAQVLAERDPAGSVESFRRVIAKELTERESKLLERTGFFLSLIDTTETDEDINRGPIAAADLEQFYSLFLDSGNVVLMIYGIRGAERNNMSVFSDRIETLTAEGNNRSVRRAAASAIETFGN